MLNFKNTSWFFAALLVLAIGLDIVFGISVWVYLTLYLLYSALFFYGCFVIEANFFTQAMCSAQTNEKVIAISFDDGVAMDYTPQVLEVLKAHQVEAAFFCIGKQVLKHPEILKQVHQQGHIIGNHSYSHHLLFDCLTANKMLSDMQRMDEVVETLIALKPRLFRPPFGVTNVSLNNAIVKGGYIPIGWNVRSFDTASKDAQKLLAKMTTSIKSGAIFLFHDTNKNTLEILPEFLQRVKAQGYKVVRLDKMLGVEAYVKPPRF